MSALERHLADDAAMTSQPEPVVAVLPLASTASVLSRIQEVRL